MATGDIKSWNVRADGKTIDLVRYGNCTGWTFNFGLGANSTPTTSTPYLTVVSEGYNASAVLGTITRTVYLVPSITITTGVARKAYPNQTIADENYNAGPDETTSTIDLSDYIYDDDKNGGAGTSGTDPTLTAPSGFATSGGNSSAAVTEMAVTTQSSAVDYPQVIGHFAIEQRRPVNSTQTIEVFVVHKFGQNGKPVACVKIKATGATSAHVEGPNIVTSMTLSARGDLVPVYATTLALTVAAGFTRGEVVNINAVAYPWLGDADSILDSSLDRESYITGTVSGSFANL